MALFVYFWRNSPTRARAASCLRFLDHTQLHPTVGRTSLDEESARRRGLCLTTHDIHKRQASMHSEGFEPAFPPSGLRPLGHWDRHSVALPLMIHVVFSFNLSGCIFLTLATKCVRSFNLIFRMHHRNFTLFFCIFSIFKLYVETWPFSWFP